MGNLEMTLKCVRNGSKALMLVLPAISLISCINYPREPFRVRDVLSFSHDRVEKKVIATVPPNRRLVIESISIIGTAPSRPVWNEILIKGTPGPNPGVFAFFSTIPLSIVEGVSGEGWHFNGHEQVRMYAEPGDDIQIGFGVLLNPSRSFGVHFSIWGYYVPINSPGLGP